MVGVRQNSQEFYVMEIYSWMNREGCLSDKALPNGNSDYSLPGRADESDSAYFQPMPEKNDVKPKGRILTVSIIAFVLVSAGIFSYYFLNQQEIDSQIMDSTSFKTLDEKMAIKYDAGRLGSDHAHAAIAVFVEGEKIDFGLPQFQLQSRYIHFENHNSYLIHKHATGVPLEMLFESFGVEITSQCIVLGTADAMTDKTFCADEEKSIAFLVNGEEVSDVGAYEIQHEDRVLISFGNSKVVTDQLEYLESLEIHGVPKRNPYVAEGDILI